ncbi:MAG: RagB/SusD family nutrient uptake outer membrane protein [Lewinella sp.]|nr:RagB/SusD family nutrient uptake outer membrane protein [Lewinella sp.]
MKCIKYILAGSLMLAAASCQLDDLPNPNGSSIEGFSQNASKSELQTLVTGIEDLLRQDVGFYYDVVSIVGREYWFFTGSDPRYTGEVLGKGGSTLDNAGFYGTRPYYGRYRTVKNANILIDAVNNSTQITQEEANGFLGFAKTFKAYELLLVANLQYTNGIRIDVDDPDNPGPFVDYDQALTAILSLLDEASTNLGAAGGSFAFKLSEAMAGFDDPAGFLKFNRGISARVALYKGGDKPGVSKRLEDSFMDLAGDLNAGPARYYSTAGGDFPNNLFRPRNQADAIIAHPSFVADLEVGDNRGSKVVKRDADLSLDGLTGSYDVWVYKSLEDFVPFIRNEELILIYAENNLGTNNSETLKALNAVRNAAGLPNYGGAQTDDALMDEIVKQRRYSLFGEGHRWIDMRRWGRLNQLPIDRPGDDVWEKFPRPVSEVQ